MNPSVANRQDAKALVCEIDEEYDKIKHTLKDVVISEDLSSYSHELKTDAGGPFTGFGVIKRSEIAAGYYSAPAGTRVAEHTHEAVEYYIVSEGRVRCIQDGEPFEAGVGEAIRILGGVSHITEIIEDAKFIVVTIPSDIGMPNAPL
jgi:quercetin dioxygenase-like cupin family protein